MTPVLRELHWLPVPKRINFKILVLTHNVVYGTAPAYLQPLIELAMTGRSTRQTAAPFLRVPIARSRRLGDRAFTHFAPPLWNSLPQSLRNTSSSPLFKSALKTYLFDL